jgi:hypothetical protein
MGVVLAPHEKDALADACARDKPVQRSDGAPEVGRTKWSGSSGGSLIQLTMLTSTAASPGQSWVDTALVMILPFSTT